MMLLNSDFSQRAIVTPDDYLWIPSPQPGVERVMLDRIGHEQARATSLVRYAPGSEFPAHSHPGGERFWCSRGLLPKTVSITLPAGTCAARTVLLTSPQVATAQPFSSSCARCLPMNAGR
jgi:anti-sigma factor ChrR (cupin superfamily)